MTSLRLASATLAAAVAAAPAAADPPPPRQPFSVLPGEKVRVWATELGGDPLVGEVTTVNAADHAGLVVMVDKEPTVVPFAAMDRLDVSRGREYAFPATVIGALLAMAVAAIVTDESVIDTDLSDLEQGSIIVGAGVLGALGGRAIGRSIPKEKWHPVDLNEVRPQPVAPAGASASLTIRF